MILNFLRRFFSHFKATELEARLYPQEGYRGKAEIEIRGNGAGFLVELEVKHSDLSDGSLCEFFIEDQKLGAVQLHKGFAKTIFQTQDPNFTKLFEAGKEVTVKANNTIVFRGTLSYD